MAETEYKLAYDGPQVSSAIGRALPGGEISTTLESKMEIEFLVNVDFANPVAQAGIGGLHGSVAYALDRWKLISGTVSGSSNGLTLNGTIRQIREFSIGFPVVPSIEMHSGTATITYDDSTKYCDITSSGGVIKRPHLGLREITDWTKIPREKYENALRECQRYFCTNMHAYNNVTSYIVNAIAYDASSISGCLFPVPMRTTPAVAFKDFSGNAQKINSKVNASLNYAITTTLATPTGISYIIADTSALNVGATYCFNYVASADL